MKFLRLNLLLVTLYFCFTGCQKPETPDQQIFTQQADSYKLMTPAYYRESVDGSSIQVRFYESPRIYDLPKSHRSFTSIKALVDANQISETPMRIYFDDIRSSYVPIKTAEKASIIEINSHLAAKETDIYTGNEKKIVANMAQLETIFDYCASQGCITATATIDYCIPFQYVVDGCYARAHKMRQIMNDEYNLSCEKVFSYEGNHGSLAVDAGDCCVLWWYHVAPLVSVKMADGTISKFVVDPSMFSEPVTIDTWTAAQETASCPGSADFGHYEITPGKIYTPGGGTDNSYASTNWTLQFYADLVTCD